MNLKSSSIFRVHIKTREISGVLEEKSETSASIWAPFNNKILKRSPWWSFFPSKHITWHSMAPANIHTFTKWFAYDNSIEVLPDTWGPSEMHTSWIRSHTPTHTHTHTQWLISVWPQTSKWCHLRWKIWSVSWSGNGLLLKCSEVHAVALCMLACTQDAVLRMTTDSLCVRKTMLNSLIFS